MPNKKMCYERKKTNLFTPKMLATAIGILITGATGSVLYAQEVVDEDLEEITVTGSRIRNTTSMTTPTPVTVVTQEELINLNPGSTMAEQLDALPQFFNTQTAQRGGGTFTSASGSFLNLRGMGASRTLILLDGSRVIPADANGSVNIDNFPSALMSRTDVITGGASAAYGADALAGVVNFVLDREFEGLKTRVSTGVSERRDGENLSLSVAGGTGLMDNRLHLIGSFETRMIDQIEADPDRLDNWHDWGLVTNPAWVSATATPNVPRRITVPNVFSNRSSPQGLITTPNFALTNFTFTDDGQGVRPYRFGEYNNSFTNGQSGGPEYTTNVLANPRGPDGNEVVQRSFFGGIKFDITDQFSVHAQAISGRTESNGYGLRGNMMIAQRTPTAAGIYDYILYKDNPYLPQVVVDEMTKANLASISIAKIGQVRGPGLLNAYDNRGNRDISQLESETVGFEWDIDDNWHLTGNYQHGESKVQTGALNIPRIDRYYLAIDAVTNSAGQIVCNISNVNPTPEQLKEFMAGKRLPSPLTQEGVTADSPIGPVNPADCRPLNILGLGNSSQEGIDYVEDEEKKSVREMEQDFAEVLLSGQIYEGWGAGPISMAVGLTWREEDLVQVTFPSFGERGVLNAPDLGIRGIPAGFAGAGNRTLHAFTGPAVGTGTSSVKEVYGELNIPVWEWASGQRITSTVAYRRSDYKTSGAVDSWKLGFDVQLLEDVRWRITKSRDVREPNMAERYFVAPGGGFVNDPVFGGASNSSLTSLGAPNPALQTEQGDTITTGFVYQPTFASWVEGLQVAIDWFEIDVGKSVGPYGAQRIVDDCFATQDPFPCGLVSRNPTTQVIERILNVQTNAGGAETRGVDLEIQYRADPNLFANEREALSMRWITGFLGERSNTSAAGTTVDLVRGPEIPEFSSNLALNYSVGDFGINVTEIFYDDTRLDINWVEGRDVDDNKVESQTYTNLGLSYGRETARGGDWRTSFNITNLFDREPPIVAGTGGQSLRNGHDQYGRRYQLSVNYNF